MYLDAREPYQHRHRRDADRDRHAQVRRTHQDRGGRPGTARGRVPADVDCRDPGLAGNWISGCSSGSEPARTILVDTSAWVEFSRGTGSAVDEQLSTLIQDRPDKIASTEPVLMELLAGGGRTSDPVTERLLRSFAWLAFDPVSDFAGAARVYRLCRAAGVTPRGLIDCMVVQVALRTGSQLLGADRDFEAIARVIPLQLVAPSR